MALKATVTTLDGLDDSVKALYKKNDDGVFALDLEEFDAHPSVRGLKSAFEKTKGELKTVKGSLDQFDGLSSDEVKALIKQNQKQGIVLNIHGKDIKSAEDLVPIVEEMLGERIKEHTTKSNKQIGDLTDVNTRLKSQLEVIQIDNMIMDVATKNGVRPSALPDLLARARQVWKLNDNGAVPMDGEKVMYGSDPSKPMTSEEWVKKLAETAPHLFNSSTGGGAGGGTGVGADGGKTITRKAFNALNAAEKMAASKTHTITD